MWYKLSQKYVQTDNFTKKRLASKLIHFYHGTYSQGITSKDLKPNLGELGIGIYVSEDEDVASSFGETTIDGYYRTDKTLLISEQTVKILPGFILSGTPCFQWGKYIFKTKKDLMKLSDIARIEGYDMIDCKGGLIRPDEEIVLLDPNKIVVR